MILHTREAEQLQKMLKKHTKKAIDQLKDEVFKSVGKASVLHDLIKESGKFEK
jgi:phage terminase Nu1 subunit (DNA packaging protein)